MSKKKFQHYSNITRKKNKPTIDIMKAPFKKRDNLIEKAPTHLV